jgi:hypothetical protein
VANVKYPKYAEALLQAGVNLSSGTVKAALIDTGTVTYNATHQYYSSVSTGVIGTPVALASKTFTNGLFDAADLAFSAVTSNTAEALILYVDTGTAGTSPLLVWMDTGVSGFPVTPNGGDINLTWNASGIFQI